MHIQGEEVEMLSAFGISAAGNKAAIDFDMTDGVASIDTCGDGVMELWFNAGEFKFRILGDRFQFQSLAIALIQAGAKS